MHYLFEVLDFKNNNIDELDVTDEYKDNLRNFLKHDEVKNISNATIYKEHEIRFIKGGSIYHGFIDLMVEYDDHIDIIDYKLSNIKDDNYLAQLNGYKKYISTISNKEITIYLYSILGEKIEKI
jgi:ATP-dependent exoDNAse (exonuclease V) beta subunit